MVNRQVRYGLRNRHISHVRYVSLKRGRQRLLLFAVLLVGIVIYYKSRLKSSKSSIETISQPAYLQSDLSNDISKVHTVLGNRKFIVETPSDSSLRVLASMDRFASEFKWNLAPSWNCQESSPFLIILITSHVSNQETRDVIRGSWCRRKHFSEGRNIACVFLLGKPEDSEEELWEKVGKESLRMKDILRGNFPDNFRNSSRKLLMGLSWILQVCPDVKYIMKTDDDVIVNTKAAIKKISNVKTAETSFIGKCWSDEPNRNPKSRFYVSVESYPQVGYPEYCSGTGYIMSGEVAKRLLHTSPTQNILPFDEVYAGLLLHKAGIDPENVPGFLLGRFDESSPCQDVSSAIAIHVHGMDMEHVWGLLKSCKYGAR